MNDHRQRFVTNIAPRVAAGVLCCLLSVADRGAADGAIRRAGTASLIVANARIWTGNRDAPWAEAIAIDGETIVAVGKNHDVERFHGPKTRRINSQGRFIAPGFIDCHVHFLTGGHRLSSVQLRNAKTGKEFSKRIREFAVTTEPGTWITGGDWDHTLWGGELPHRSWIDAVTASNPVWVNRLDGHMALANTRALRAAGVTRETPDVAGGTIVRDKNGEPTGILKDNAMALVERIVPSPTAAQSDRGLDTAMQYVAAQGVTSVHHMGTWDDLEVFERAHQRGKLRTRIYAAVPLSTWKRLESHIEANGRGHAWLRVGCLKGFVDGSLGSHTAAFIEPYTDEPSDRGLLVNTRDDLLSWTTGADRAKLQVAVHAIGDRAIRMQLGIYEQVANANGPRDRRFRIEHAQHISAWDLPRFRHLRVIPSMQPYHCIDDGRWAEPLIGPKRAKTTYAFRSLIDMATSGNAALGSRPVFGSDWYVAPATPIEGIYAAVTRRTLDGKHPNGWIPQQKITVEEALRAYTSDAAYASFEEATKGMLEPGKLADFVMLDQDPTKVPGPKLRGISVLMTVVGGHIVFSHSTAETKD